MLLPFCCCFFFIASRCDGESTNNEAHQLVQWLIDEEGTFNPKLEVRRTDPDKDSSAYGIFAKEKLEEEELLLSIPNESFITPSYKDTPEDLPCALVERLIKEIELGDSSDYAPYVNYLLSLPTGQLPSTWSDAGQQLLHDVLRLDENEPQRLPPVETCTWIEEDWLGVCDGKDDPLSIQAASLVIQNFDYDKLVPVVNIMRHRNGRWLNTHTSSAHEGIEVNVRASRIIEAGEELYTTQNLCDDCEGKNEENYGTPELLRDYGFIENFPQRWIIQNEQFSFDIDEVYNSNGIATGELALTWLEDNFEYIDLIDKELTRLENMSATHFEIRNLDVPDNEWEVALQFYNAYTVALSLAIEKANGYDDKTCPKKGECSFSSNNRYIDLHHKPDPHNYNDKACDHHGAMLFPDYLLLETIKSPYQELSFFRDPQNSETCFDLDSTVQICTSYRPHYHEGSVHLPARFIAEVKRILFVGGGDSMILHETLKYPSLEKVVGLELDQTVPRKCFKHFGSQPHWDNDKVEWWFGDATKSLLMLPKDYFGSFDLVIVDLSETVMSFSVTDKLDIMEALSLLVKEDGIFVKNEKYFDNLVPIFKHTAQLHWYDNPLLCDQSMVMGSNSIDFSKGDVFDHKVDTLWLEPLKSVTDTMDLVHDFKRNNASLKLCKEDDQEVEPIIQEKSPGIIMIVEAESVKSDIKDTEKITRLILEALEKVDITDVSTFGENSDDNASIISAIFQDGYITTRTWSKEKYCAFDIHLWSSFEKHEDVKKALLGTFDSKNESSSFRIVAGGMFGVSTWKVDERNKGPRYTQVCNMEEDKICNNALEEDAMDIVLEESIKLVLESQTSILVICGPQNQSCKSLDVLKNTESEKNIIPIWDCLSIGGMTNRNSKENTNVMFECEIDVLDKLLKEAERAKFGAIVLDENLSFTFASIILRIFKARHEREQILRANTIVISLLEEKGDQWRKSFLDRFWTDVFIYEPCFKAEVTFRSTFEAHIISHGDEHFGARLGKFVKITTERTGLISEVRSIHGGEFDTVYNYQPSKLWLPKDYDRDSPHEQWKAQKPFGLQTIFQLEKKKGEMSSSQIKDTLEKALLSIESSPTDTDNLPNIKSFDKVGDGCLLVACWSGGNVNILWDGRQHIDINLFTYAEDFDTSKKFESIFTSHIPKLTTKLRDEQPRGTGRVVNFLGDIEHEAHWMFVGHTPNIGLFSDDR